MGCHLDFSAVRSPIFSFLRAAFTASKMKLLIALEIFSMPALSVAPPTARIAVSLVCGTMVVVQI